MAFNADSENLNENFQKCHLGYQTALFYEKSQKMGRVVHFQLQFSTLLEVERTNFKNVCYRAESGEHFKRKKSRIF